VSATAYMSLRSKRKHQTKPNHAVVTTHKCHLCSPNGKDRVPSCRSVQCLIRDEELSMSDVEGDAVPSAAPVASGPWTSTLAGLELWHPGLEEVKEASQEPVAAEA
jgi:hypothetical protein